MHMHLLYAHEDDDIYTNCYTNIIMKYILFYLNVLTNMEFYGLFNCILIYVINFIKYCIFVSITY